MKTTTTNLMMLFLLLLTVITSYGQQAIVSSGASVETESGSVSYTVGQVFYAYVQGDAGSLSGGVQQPYSITKTSVQQNDAIQLSFKAYPNPTVNELYLSINDWCNEHANNLQACMFNASGKQVQLQNVGAAITTFNMAHLPQATYLLILQTSQGQVVEKFQIIKY